MRITSTILLLFTLLATATAGGISRQAKARYAYFFQGAVTRLSAGDTDGAMDLLLHCQEIDPSAAETYFYLADCYNAAGEDSMRVNMLVKAAEMQPDNDTYKEELIPIYINNEQIDECVVLLEDLVARTPERTDMLELLQKIYEYQKDDQNLLNTLNRLEVQEGQSEELTMSKVQVFTRMGDNKRAYSELKSLVDNHPLDLNYRVIMGNWLLNNGRKKEALNELNTVLDSEPENKMALISMMEYYRSEKQDTIADRMRDNLLLSPKTDQQTRLTMLRLYIFDQEARGTDSTEVVRYFDRVYDATQDFEVLPLQLAYMSLKSMPDEQLKQLLLKMLNLRPEYSQARLQLMQMAENDEDHEEVARLAKPAQQYNPDEWSFSYYLGFALFQMDRKEEAIEAFEVAAQGAADDTENTSLAADLFEMMGDVYYDLGRKDEAFAAYDKCLAIDPDKISCLNNYAYYLALSDMNLDRAAAMSLKTVKAEPNSATYLDTYAWVLYVQGRYEEAKIYIDMAIEKLPEDADRKVYLEHQQTITEKLQP